MSTNELTDLPSSELPKVKLSVSPHDRPSEKVSYELRDYPQNYGDHIIAPLMSGEDLRINGVFYPSDISYGALEEEISAIDRSVLVGGTRQWQYPA